jgi:hypothetical protein
MIVRMSLDFAECDRARLARNPAYDGRFYTNSVVQCVGPGFAHLLNRDAFRIVVLAALMFAIRS